MDNLEKAILVLFRHVPAQKVIEEEISSTDITYKDFVRLMKIASEGYSETELGNLYHYLTCSFVDELHGAEYGRNGKESLDVFGLLRHYAEWVLTEQDGEIVCEYCKFLHWRKATESLGEDLLAACFIASKKRENARECADLDWKASITHNNWELHKILEQGMAENHSHLKGTSPIFPLTWISLMNNLYLDGEYADIQRIEENRRKIGANIYYGYQEESLSVQLLQAACLRYMMFRAVCCVLWEEGVSKELAKQCEEYCAALKNPKYLYGIKEDLSVSIMDEQNVLRDRILPDYAMAGVLREKGDLDDRTAVFQGERWLFYHFFSGIFSKTKLYAYRDWFYAYLLIKENFRAEFVQGNKDVGFENFRIYEGRKDIFLENSFFKKELVKKAIEACFAESRDSVMETRIAPKRSAEEYSRFMREVDGWFSNKKTYHHRLFYVVHFIKGPDSAKNDEFVACRHSKNRAEYKEQALCLARFREEYPNEAMRIRGIDAANMEIGCGPEVFAQIFRYLSDHKVFLEMETERKVPQLKKTYHVGEDFLDLASGLRAIDEAVHFLEMRCGDRLGHAIALGIDANDWYRSKNDRILLAQQEYLDNVAWMYHMAVSCHMDDKESVLSFLREEYEYYFQMIYRNAMDQRMLDYISQMARKYYKGTEWEKYYSDRPYDFSIENYYMAWELRGDDPDLYSDGFFANNSIVGYRYQSFSYYAINRNFPEKQNKRYLQEAALLYYYYHYNRGVRREGRKIIEKKVDRAYVHCAGLIQRELQKIVAARGIGIETNPSSNKLIGTFGRYDKHPILNFYNKGLIEEGEKLRDCPQLSVSINTDDAGIFSTSLENEYAYMALALEKAKDEQGNPLYKRRNIYEWLDNIRMMGMRQAFLGEEEMKKAMKEWTDDRKRKETLEYDSLDHSSDIGLFYADFRGGSDCRVFKG